VLELPPPGSRTRVGDLALTFGEHAPSRTRSGPWSELATGTGWRLWATPPAATWQGYGLRREPGPDLRLTLGDRPEHWLSLRHDGEDDTWHLRTDRFATLHAYVGDRIVTTFSPSAWGDDPSLDWGSIAGFVRLGWYPSDRLPVRGVRVVRPATEVSWGRDGHQVAERRWRGWEHAPSPEIDVAAAADRLAEVLDEVLDAQAAEGRVGLPISGGLDSRTTVATLTRSGHDRPELWAYGYGYDQDSPELRIAGEVARARGLDLAVVVVPPHLFDDLDAVVDATEGLVDVTLCRQASVAGALRAETDAVVAAHWGDVWFGAPSPDAGSTAADSLLSASTKRGHEWLTRNLVMPHLGHDPEEELAAVLATEEASLATVDDPTVRLLALKTQQWSFRWTQSTLRAFRLGTEPRLPYYDPRVADLALSLPSGLLGGRQVQIELLRRHAPDLARIEWQAFETDLFRLRRERTWRLPRRALRRAARRLRPPTARLRNWEVQLLAPAGRAGVDRWLVEPGSPLEDLVDPQAVRQLVAEHRARPTDPGLGYAVSSLLTFATWKARFT